MSGFVFRAYDQAELDRQMNARGTVPDIAPFVAAYASESARCRAELPCDIGVKYGPSDDERLDVFPAAGKRKAPVYVFIHGGYWRLLDASDSSFMARALTGAGACVVAINYGLAPATPLREIVRQCAAAMGWVADNIARYGGDPDNIHVSGSSAGGHLAAMMLSETWQAIGGVPRGAIRSASPLSGLHDLVPVQLSHCNGWLALDPAEARALSPMHNLPVLPVPQVVAYAPNETEEFKRQSEVYAAASAALGAKIEVLVEPGTNHFDLPLKLMDENSTLFAATARLMGL